MQIVKQGCDVEKNLRDFVKVNVLQNLKTRKQDLYIATKETTIFAA